jgi:hypothetical protein
VTGELDTCPDPCGCYRPGVHSRIVGCRRKHPLGETSFNSRPTFSECHDLSPGNRRANRDSSAARRRRGSRGQGQERIGIRRSTRCLIQCLQRQREILSVVDPRGEPAFDPFACRRELEGAGRSQIQQFLAAVHTAALSRTPSIIFVKIGPSNLLTALTPCCAHRYACAALVDPERSSGRPYCRRSTSLRLCCTRKVVPESIGQRTTSTTRRPPGLRKRRDRMPSDL